jgi:hypothetical protein
MAVKYNLIINTKYAERDSKGLVSDIKSKTGTILVVWEHREIPSIVRAFGIQNFKLTWGDDDYDSIWIISFKNGTTTITFDKEALLPSVSCPD